MNLYVGNLPYSIDEAGLRQLFEEHGAVSTASVIMDKYSGRSKGFGFVEMDDQVAAEAAIEKLNGSSVDGRDIKVNQARPREERPRRDSGSW
ncbi:MAG: RNA recognition motif domain-containing protein [Gammaproteobacteria bacterium]